MGDAGDLTDRSQIDELMGHRAGSRGDREGSTIGRRYRHTTPEMRDRVLAVLEVRLAITLEVANRLLGA